MRKSFATLLALFAMFVASACATSEQSVSVGGRASAKVPSPPVGETPASTSPLVASQPRSSDGVVALWSGESGGFLVTLTKSDLSVARESDPSRVVFSAARTAKAEFESSEAEAMAQSQAATPDDCTHEHEFRVLSLVGSILSYEDKYFATCREEAHPTAQTDYFAVDLTRPETPAKLSDYFDERAILEALLADRIIARALKDLETVATPRKLDELERSLAGQPLAIGNCEFELPKDFLSRFAFHHVQGGQVAVRIGLPPSVGACRTQHAQLGLLLPTPAVLRSPLTVAATQGFLVKDLSKGVTNTAKVKFVTGEGVAR